MAPSPTLALDQKVKARIKRGERVTPFHLGEPDFDTPVAAAQAAIDAIHAGKTHYTQAAGIPELRAAVAGKLRRDQGLAYAPEDVLVSVGAKHSLYNLFMTVLDPGDEVVIPSPYWVTYPDQVRLTGAIPVIVPCGPDTGYKLTAAALKEALGPRTRAVVLNSPQNPTGAVYTRQELEDLARVIVGHPDLLVVSDEIYEKLVYGTSTHTSIASLGPEIFARTVVVNGCSKAYAMTGWRIGYMAGPRPIIQAAGDFQSQVTSNPTSIAQWAAVEAIAGDQSPVEAMRRAFDRRRQLMVEHLSAIEDVTVMDPGGAFYCFPDVSRRLQRPVLGRMLSSSAELAELLLEEAQVSTVPGEAFGAPGHLRLSYACDDDTIREGVGRMRDLLAR